MKRIAVLALGFAGAALPAAVASAATIHVEAGGSIQAAVDAAADGDRVVVGPGTYVENVVVSGRTRFSLVARGATLEAADGSVAALAIDGSSRVRVRGFTLEGGIGGCVQVTGGSDVRVLRNRVSAALGVGIGADASPGVRIVRNVLTGCGEGIVLSLGSDDRRAAVTGNRVTDCDAGAIRVDGGTDGRVSGNVVADCGGVGIEVSGLSQTVVSNRVTRSGDDGMVCGSDESRISGNVVVRPAGDGIVILGSENAVQVNLISASAEAAVELQGSSNFVAGNACDFRCQMPLDDQSGDGSNILVQGGVRVDLGRR